ncbi:hypothetical protein ERX46_08585 [Brumimicrobium glaciale]|uniref:Uncharacterized protein n=1 Tax=Brumimicrobium glaciale TaxID=200475 RepID=A0A4Q4KL70_9FLAO|nr:class I SAM-dependent methyltransferase [Brumimicrobium glaciale]RYM34012.1 hypothetical protein ERX46_08585 [Brumimicrobium glaciale]
MKIFYQHTRLIILTLSVLNIIVHITGFYYGIDLFNLFSTLVISELLLIILYLIITVYKWINDGFIKTETEQINFSKQVSRSISKNLERIEKFENTIIDEIKNSHKKNIAPLFSQSEAILDSVNLLREQTNHNNDENLRKHKIIGSALEKTEKLSENSIEKMDENNDYLKNLEEVVNEKTSKLFTRFTQIDTNNNSMILKLEQIGQAIAKNNEKLNTIKATVSEEVNKSNEKISQLITTKNLDLNNIVNEIFTTIAQESTKTSSEIKDLEEVILPKIDTVLSKIDTSRLESSTALVEIGAKMKQSKSELNSFIQEEMGNFLDKQRKNISSIEIILKNEILRTSNDQYYAIRKELNNTYIRLDALHSIYHLLKFEGRLPIMHDWTVSSDYASEVVNSILLNNGGTILDIGSGISTVLYGAAIKKCGKGRVISLEHSKEYYDKTISLIREHKLEDICEIHYCPLKEYVIAGKKWLWYDIEKVKLPKELAIISVDGPPGDTQHLARYPVLPILISTVSLNTIIYLDDANRDEEQEIAKQWKNQFNLNLDYNNSNKGFVKFTKKNKTLR